jgi:Fur family ferric uptake transcriptional regulator
MYDCNMSTGKNRLAATLRNSGYSTTNARLAVFAALEHSEPITMKRVIANCPGVDRASVYRTVDLYEKLGILQRIQIGWKYKLELTDQFHDHHHHLSCTNCHKIVAIDEDKKLENMLEEISIMRGFKPTSHQLEIQGLCKECQES